jgi:hypothetical protein
MNIKFTSSKIRLFYLMISIISIGSIFLFCSKSDSPNNKKAEATPHKTSLVQNAIAASTETALTAAKAIESSQANRQYLLVLFHDKTDDSYQQMENAITDFQHSSSENIQVYKALTTDLKEADIINKYGINRAPLPVTLVFAPNGAITGGFPKQITREQLEQSIVSELIMKILKSIQANKVVLVILKNSTTKFNNEVTEAANAFSMDKRLNGLVDIIQQNPKESEINDFLSQCSLDKNMTEASVALIVPPGKIGGVYSGKITKETLIAGLASCSGGGCCPK